MNRRMGPIARPCHHSLVMFSIKTLIEFYGIQHMVTFLVPSRLATCAKVVADHLAGVLRPSSWNTDFTHVTWVLRWVGGKGLQPVRPIVAVKTKFRIDGKKVVQLSR